VELVMTKTYWSKVKSNGRNGREPLYREVEDELPHLVVEGGLRYKTKDKLVNEIQDGAQAGVSVVLPSTHTDGPRDMQRRYQDPRQSTLRLVPRLFS